VENTFGDTKCASWIEVCSLCVGSSALPGNYGLQDQAAALAISQMKERSHYVRKSAEAKAREEKQLELAVAQMKERIDTTKA